MRRAGLRFRVARLTPKQKLSFLPPKLSYELFERPQAEISGYWISSGASVERQPCESLANLKARAFIELNTRYLFASYPVGIEAPPARTLTATPPKPAPFDPFALAGIGKTDPRYVDYSRENWG